MIDYPHIENIIPCIIEQAVKDYKRACKTGDKYLLKNLQNFFNSDYCNSLIACLKSVRATTGAEMLRLLSDKYYDEEIFKEAEKKFSEKYDIDFLKKREYKKIYNKIYRENKKKKED